MATTRFKGETAGERLDYSSISDSDMLQLRHKPGTIEDEDKGISKSQLLSCPFGVSSTAAGTAAKTASLTDSNPDFILVSGREVVVCFTTANTASNPTLNFAGSGAIPIYFPNGSAVGVWDADTWMHLKYFYATVGNTSIQRWILMSPLSVDIVASNSKELITSGGVASAIDIPKDAVLHYSFDEVPDYPDGTADEKYLNGNTYNVSFSGNGTVTTDSYVAGDNKIHKSNVNGNANYKSDLSVSLKRGAFRRLDTFAGKILIFEFFAKTSNLQLHIEYMQTSSSEILYLEPLGDTISIGKHRVALFIPDGVYSYTLTMYANMIGDGYLEWELLNWYIGNGSYSTPIIDNANGHNNATNNGGIATKGVSGKGILLPARTSGEISVSSIIPNTDKDISVSLWVKFDTTYSQTNQLGLFIIGLTNGLFGFVRTGSADNVNILAFARVSSSESSGVTETLQKGMFYHLTMTYDKSQKRVKLYVNGEYKGQGNTLTTSNFNFGESTQFLWKINSSGIVQGTDTDPSTTTPHTIDDLLIFDRALTENEVIALYLNKGNTPKYYSCADWKLEQMTNTTRSVIEQPPEEENREDER